MEFHSCSSENIVSFSHQAVVLKDVMVVRYYQDVRWRNRDVILTGVLRKESDGSRLIVGLSNAGMTLYSARIKNGQIVILKNNMGISDRFLCENIIFDVGLFCWVGSEGGKSFCHTGLDGVEEIWQVNPADVGDCTGYFVFRDGRMGYARLCSGRCGYSAEFVADKNGYLESVVVENIARGYKSRIRVLRNGP